MRVIRGLGPPSDSGLPADNSHEYATWDAAYVLGSLSPADRREYEAHLSVCPFCTQAVAELSGMPALLSKLDSDTVASINDQTDETPMAPNLLPSLLFAVRRRRHRSRVMTWSATSMSGGAIHRRSPISPPGRPPTGSGTTPRTRTGCCGPTGNIDPTSTS